MINELISTHELRDLRTKLQRAVDSGQIKLGGPGATIVPGKVRFIDDGIQEFLEIPFNREYTTDEY